MIFQDDLLFPHLSVAGNASGSAWKGWRRVAEAGRAAGRGGRRAFCGVDRLLDRLAGGSYSGRRAAAGSAWRGRCQRPAPGLLLCDASRSPRSTWTAAMRWSAASATSSVPWQSRCSTSRTASPRPSPWARGCSCWSGARSSPTGRRWTSSPRRGDRATDRSVLKACSTSFSARVEDHAPELNASEGYRLDDGPELIVRIPGPARRQHAPRRDPGRRHPARPTSRRRTLRPQPGPGHGRTDRPPRSRGRGRHPHRRADLDRQPGRAGGGTTSLLGSPGSEVHMIIKARSCHVIDDQDASPQVP